MAYVGVFAVSKAPFHLSVEWVVTKRYVVRGCPVSLSLPRDGVCLEVRELVMNKFRVLRGSLAKVV